MRTILTISLFTLLVVGLFALFVKIKSVKEYSIFDDLEVSSTIKSQPDSIRNMIALNELVYGISMLTELEDMRIGLDGKKSTQPDYLSFLQKWATTNQLVKLTDHGSPLVRSMAFQALKNKKYSGLKEVFERHLYDAQTYSFHSGCIIETIPVNVDFYRCIYSTLTTAEATSYKNKLLTKYKGTYFEHMLWFP